MLLLVYLKKKNNNQNSGCQNISCKSVMRDRNTISKLNHNEYYQKEIPETLIKIKIYYKCD